MSRPAELAARRLIFARPGKPKLRFADRARQNLNGIVGAVESERMDGVGARDAKMNWDSSRNQNAVRNEQVLLRDDANCDRAIRFLLGSQIVLDKLSREVEQQWVNVARALQKVRQGNVDLIVAGGRDQAQNQHGQQERS
jgi:hypothetical protein